MLVRSPAVLLCFTLALGAVLGPAGAQSGYPKINLAAGYRVDPAWPQRPPDVRWRYVTGVAVVDTPSVPADRPANAPAPNAPAPNAPAPRPRTW